MSYNVCDARNGNTTGPYSKADAEKMAADLNAMVYRNTFVRVFGDMDLKDVKVTGPFYVRPAKIDALTFGGEEIPPALTAAAVAGAALCVGLVGWLVFSKRPVSQTPAQAKPAPQPAKQEPVAKTVPATPAPAPAPAAAPASAKQVAPPPAPAGPAIPAGDGGDSGALEGSVAGVASGDNSSLDDFGFTQ